jgi:hypothetical protein
MSDIKIRVGQQNAIKVASSLVGAPRPRTLRLTDLEDVNADPDSLLNGMVLVYNQSTDKWDATLELTPGNTQNLDINGGSF